MTHLAPISHWLTHPWSPLAGWVTFYSCSRHPTPPPQKVSTELYRELYSEVLGFSGSTLKAFGLVIFIIENPNWTFYLSTKMFILNKENYVGNQNTRHQLRKCWKITKIVAVSWSLSIIGGSFSICAVARLRAKVEIRSNKTRGLRSWPSEKQE